MKKINIQTTNKWKILVVDDNEGINEALKLMLESVGYEVETSLDGEVLEKLPKNNLPNLILLDRLLSGRDGNELCRLVKSDSRTKAIPVIIMSAHPAAEKDWREAGAEDFVAKPFEIKKLQAKITKFLS